MTQFTPGPWLKSHRKNGKVCDGLEMYATQVYTQDGETIATLHWYPKPMNKGVVGTYREANARLIAEAPAMYEVLRSLLIWADSADNLNNDFAKARAILARVDGDKP